LIKYRFPKENLAWIISPDDEYMIRTYCCTG